MARPLSPENQLLLALRENNGFLVPLQISNLEFDGDVPAHPLDRAIHKARERRWIAKDRYRNVWLTPLGEQAAQSVAIPKLSYQLLLVLCERNWKSLSASEIAMIRFQTSHSLDDLGHRAVLQAIKDHYVIVEKDGQVAATPQVETYCAFTRCAAHDCRSCATS